MSLQKEAFTPAEANKLSKYHSKRLAQVAGAWFNENPAPFTNLYDFGCGQGYYLRAIEEGYPNGPVGIGFDGCQDLSGCQQHKSIVHPVDLGAPFFTGLPPGHVMSIEVAEHIAEARLPAFLGNLERHCRSKLLLTWAKRGQAGTRHVSCRNQDEVVPMVERLGFKFLEKPTMDWRRYVGEEIWYFKETIYAFARR